MGAGALFSESINININIRIKIIFLLFISPLQNKNITFLLLSHIPSQDYPYVSSKHLPP
jgi:hypothetical protein